MNQVFVEKFADVKILRYGLPGFEELELKQKLYVYYLSQAALCGRDILWDQNNRFNLKIRRLLETVFVTCRGDREGEAFRSFHQYLKRVWLANGIHHHYSADKFVPEPGRPAFECLVQQSDLSALAFKAELPGLLELLFDPARESKRLSLDGSKDLLAASSMNYYSGVSQPEAEAFYASLRKEAGEEAPAYGLNTRLVKEDGILREKVWKQNGLYGEAIAQIIFWLGKALPYAENEQQQTVIRQLVDYYRTGDLRHFDQYSIGWVAESEGRVDFINGFIEVYGDPLGIKGSWEALVSYQDPVGSRRARVLSENAGWFERHSPVDGRFKKSKVNGVSARVINAAMLGGDCYPSTPIGINLPNAEWIRERYGSKSVTIENITRSYFLDSLDNGMLEEFAFSGEEIERARKYGYLAGNLHTDLHECLGHGSGRMMPGVNPEDLKNYYSAIEEARADLFALYYIADPKVQELGLVSSSGEARAEYDAYLRGGLLTQLTRIEPGRDLEESHMRNRQLICRWVYEYGKPEGVTELICRDGKTYVVIRNYDRLRQLFGLLLREVQRIKSEGDLPAARQLVETYGVKVDRLLHREVLERFKKLDIAPYAGFVNPRLKLVKNKRGQLADVTVDYTQGYTEQMLEYAARWSFLPV
ncbi:MAG: dihydrofolate reductase [Mangrovibacterium sp.]